MAPILMCINYWAELTISLSVLFVAIMLLICCTCWQGKKKKFNQFYVMDESAFRDMKTKKNKSKSMMKNADCQPGFFRKFSLTTGSLTNATSILKSSKPSPTYLSTKVRHNSENELLDSLDFSNEFDEAILQIDALTPKLPSVEEDRLSCFSNDSKFTFYSTYTNNRAPSIADTMKSALSRKDSDFSSK